jgi:ATP-binding cassette subfamily E protein 1
MSDKLTRIAIVSTDKCKPKKCRQECRKSCPVVRMGGSAAEDGGVGALVDASCACV